MQEWITKAKNQIAEKQKELGEWVKVPQGTTEFEIDTDTSERIVTTDMGDVFLFKLKDGAELMASPFLRGLIISAFPESVNGFFKVKITRTGKAKDTRYEVIGA